MLQTISIGLMPKTAHITVKLLASEGQFQLGWSVCGKYYIQKATIRVTQQNMNKQRKTDHKETDEWRIQSRKYGLSFLLQTSL
jgi:hypothetical protein